ncbi:hypothetical protein [Herbiconiux sp.]|uniref:hypothetical protein n=1 Tax=Herbiconiux sp. TaxID=1871186 RepID=UPI0025C539B7|nr:hypothetical protein [Herbiconiux sp.]
MTEPHDASVSHPSSAAAAVSAFSSFEPDDLDGHTIDELSDYLDAGRMPADPSIEGSAGCQIALAALARLRAVSVTLLETEASSEPAPDENWISGILQSIGREARAGRRIPVSHPDPAADLALTEGSVRGLVRAAGDAIPGLVIGRCSLDGDVTLPGEPITVRIEASALWGTSIPDAAAALREAVISALGRHTELVLAGVDVIVHDLLPAPTPVSTAPEGAAGTTAAVPGEPNGDERA